MAPDNDNDQAYSDDVEFLVSATRGINAQIRNSNVSTRLEASSSDAARSVRGVLSRIKSSFRPLADSRITNPQT